MKLFFDTETTDLPNFKLSSTDTSQPHIVQLAALLEDSEGVLRGEINLLIRPDGYDISDSTKHHGITHETAEKYGVPVEVAVGLFLQMLDKSQLVVGHNVSMDFFMMRIAAHRCKLKDPKEYPIEKFDTMHESKNIVKLPPTEKMLRAGFKSFKSPNLQEAHKHFMGVEFEGAHDAMNDVKATRAVYYKILKDRLDKGPAVDFPRSMPVRARPFAYLGSPVSE